MKIDTNTHVLRHVLPYGNARHGCEFPVTDIQSIREIDDTGCTFLSEIGNIVTNITGVVS